MRSKGEEWGVLKKLTKKLRVEKARRVSGWCSDNRKGRNKII